MRYQDVTSPRAIRMAMRECDRLGRDAFLEKYGFDRAREYVLRHDGKEYDSKAVVGVAHRYQYPDEGPLGPHDFSGGRNTVGSLLVKLGFDVDGIERSPEDWSPEEVDTLVQDYFDMLAMELRGEHFVKSHRNEALRAVLEGRSKGSIERKHQNVSAVLHAMGLPFIDGYKPLGNIQAMLAGYVSDYLAENPDFFDAAPEDREARLPELVEPPASRQDEAARRGAHLRRAANVDFALRDQANRQLGEAGEEMVVRFERRRLAEVGRPDLAARVRWASRDDGDGLGYDIESFDEQGASFFIEVKATNGGPAAPFYVSANEIAFSKEEGPRFALYRVFDISGAPRLYVLKGPIERTCVLKPSQWQAWPLE